MKIDRLEVRWLRGKSENWTNLAANQIWDITQGEQQARTFTPHDANVSQGDASLPLDKSRVAEFWEKQHAAMDAMKRERNFAKAAALFREALAISPSHEDSHYYLANCLAELDDIPSAISELEALARINPQNHRAFQRKGELLAASASSRNQLVLARQSLDVALSLNSEETGTLSLLGQVALAQEDFVLAERDFVRVCQANPRAASAWYFRGYLAWKRRDLKDVSTMLASTRNARGHDWKPAGSVSEGDVRHRMFSESGFLNIFEQRWDGSSDAARAYVPRGRLSSSFSAITGRL